MAYRKKIVDPLITRTLIRAGRDRWVWMITADLGDIIPVFLQADGIYHPIKV